jgi:hypothetical protein
MKVDNAYRLGIIAATCVCLAAGGTLLLLVLALCGGGCANKPLSADAQHKAGHDCSPESGGGWCDSQTICGHDVFEDPTGTCPHAMCCFVGPDDNGTLMMHHPNTPRHK